MNERIEKIKEVLADEAFVNTLLEADSPEAAQKLLADKGADMSIEEIDAVGDMIDKYTNGDLAAEELEKFRNGELNDEDLEQVAGGDLICAGIVTFVLLSGALITTEGIMHACGTSLKRICRGW